MKKDIELVVTHCKHEDCVYRAKISASMQSCDYILIEKRPRGCKISECDKYKTGTKKINSNFVWFDVTAEDDELL